MTTMTKEKCQFQNRIKKAEGEIKQIINDLARDLDESGLIIMAVTANVCSTMESRDNYNVTHSVFISAAVNR